MHLAFLLWNPGGFDMPIVSWTQADVATILTGMLLYAFANRMSLSPIDAWENRSRWNCLKKWNDQSAISNGWGEATTVPADEIVAAINQSCLGLWWTSVCCWCQVSKLEITSSVHRISLHSRDSTYFHVHHMHHVIGMWLWSIEQLYHLPRLPEHGCGTCQESRLPNI